MQNYYYSFTLSLFSVFIFTTTLPGNGLPVFEACPLADHLLEINKEWKNHLTDDFSFYQPVIFNNDNSRIQLHLKLVEQTLRQKKVAHLAKSQVKNRLALLDQLRIYWQRGSFPKNTGHSNRQPYFIDNYGTACAVGYLALQSGADNLVNRIREENNFAFIKEMPYPELKAWAKVNGFTMEELAWIQPAYPPDPSRIFTKVGTNGNVEGHINIMKVDETGDRLYLAGDFSEIDGKNANSIIAWNGNSWSTLGDGLIGEIFALEWVEDKLYAGGNFRLPNQSEKSNLAYWDGQTWNSVQNGNMEGSVFALKPFGHHLYVGGDFQKVDGKNKAHLAALNTSNFLWSNIAAVVNNGQTTIAEGGMEVNAPVRCFELVNENLLVGGDFTLTAPGLSSDSPHQLVCRYLAYWDGITWVDTLDGVYTPVHTIANTNGELLIGGDLSLSGTNSIAVRKNEIWTYEDWDGMYTPMGDGHVYGFYADQNENFYVYGGLDFAPSGIGDYGSGVVSLFEGIRGNGFATFDGAVKTMAEFQGNLYFAGDFQMVNGVPIDGLSVLDFINGNINPSSRTEIQVYSSDQQLKVTYQALKKDAVLALFNMQGQKIHAIQLEQGEGEKSISLNQFPVGTYIYQVVNNSVRQSGKWIYVK